MKSLIVILLLCDFLQSCWTQSENTDDNTDVPQVTKATQKLETEITLKDKLCTHHFGLDLSQKNAIKHDVSELIFEGKDSCFVAQVKDDYAFNCESLKISGMDLNGTNVAHEMFTFIPATHKINGINYNFEMYILIGPNRPKPYIIGETVFCLLFEIGSEPNDAIQKLLKSLKHGYESFKLADLLPKNRNHYKYKRCSAEEDYIVFENILSITHKQLERLKKYSLDTKGQIGKSSDVELLYYGRSGIKTTISRFLLMCIFVISFKNYF